MRICTIYIENRTDLRGVRVRNTLGVDPVLGLLVFGVVNLLRRVDRWLEVLEEVASVVALAVEEHIVCVVGTNGVHVSTFR